MAAVLRVVLAACLVAAAILGGAAPADAAARPGLAVTVTIRYGAALQDLRASGRFHGTAAHLPASTVVQVQRRAGSGTWRTVATAKTSANGAFSGAFPASGLGRTSFRARVAATATRAPVTSPTRVATVAEFFHLDSIRLAQPADGVSFAPVTTPQGDVVPHTIVMDGAAVTSGVVTATWDLGGYCSRFLVLADALEEDGLVATTSVGSGQRVLSSTQLTDDGVEFIQTPLAGTHRLALVTRIEKKGTGAQKVAWISASVLCTVDPRSL